MRRPASPWRLGRVCIEVHMDKGIEGEKVAFWWWCFACEPIRGEVTIHSRHIASSEGAGRSEMVCQIGQSTRERR